MNEFSLKRITLFLVVVLLGVVLVWQLYYFVPGFLLAITMYILMRKTYFRLVTERKVKPSLAATILILLALIILALPIWVVVQVLIPKVSYLASNYTEIMHKAQVVAAEVQRKFPQAKINSAQVEQVVRRGIGYVPGIFGTTGAILANLATAFFVVYFMLKGGRDMERKVIELLPLKAASKESIWRETQSLIVSNAIGIPLLAVCQGIIAIIGYWIFGVDGFVMWGMITGICSLLPVIGTMIVWIPMVIYLFAIGESGNAIGLLLFSAIIISNIDNVLRFTIMRKLGDVHPLITVFGVIVGLQLFGFIGLIFGPLFIAYFLLMIKIYRAEFSTDKIIVPGVDDRQP
ncbi:MAG: AI-2E family transporter [Sphingobacteriales bacterium]|nr:MAG: AI-2E family transporter [Sphingobacteriales bacterium]